MRKNIKNYTTSIAVRKTIGEIEELLVSKGAEKIMIDYANQEPIGLMFMLKTDRGQIPIKLPARVSGVEAIFYKNKKPRHNWMNPEPLNDREKDQAKRTAWRNIKDWIDAQLALVETEMVRMEEVFLPYIIMPGNKTVFESFQSGALQLGPGNAN